MPTKRSILRNALCAVAVLATAASGLVIGGVDAHADDQRPANDDFADATVIESLPYTVSQDISGATYETLELMPECITGTPLVGEASLVLDTAGSDNNIVSVWFAHRATGDGPVTIDLSESWFEPAVAVYDVTEPGDRIEVACQDQASRLVVDLRAGRRYAVQVVHYKEAARFQLGLSMDPGDVVRSPQLPATRPDTSTDSGPGDVTVVAVLDRGLSPYHWDFLASQMPQALDDNPRNDLPLHAAPHTWIPGFPSPSEFGDYGPLELTLDEQNPLATADRLIAHDDAAWSTIRTSRLDSVQYRWIPGTKVVGAVTFSPGGRIEPAGGSDHGHRVASTAVGNVHGNCPQCVLVYVQVDDGKRGETVGARNDQVREAFQWAQAQPWIDVVSSSIPVDLETLPGSPERHTFASPDFADNHLDVAAQRAASERGQTTFQASGNGMSNNFVVPNPAFTNSHMGPDWLVTVGGVRQTRDHLSGSGKFVDLAAPATWVKVSSAYTPIGRHAFTDGTSFSAPAVAGIYANALHQVRRMLPGPSRIQQHGTIAVDRAGSSFTCGATRPGCELADGALTADELRQRLFEAAVPGIGRGTTTGIVNPDDTVPEPDVIAEEWRMANEGHGVFLGRMQSDAAFRAEIDRILDPIAGVAPLMDRPAGERDWMIVDSYCRQQMWGAWDDGYYSARTTVLPGPDASWPLRSSYEAACPLIEPAPAT